VIDWPPSRHSYFLASFYPICGQTFDDRVKVSIDNDGTFTIGDTPLRDLVSLSTMWQPPMC
jgi:hypothetical protein